MSDDFYRREPDFGWDLPPGCSQRHIDEAFGSGDEEESEPEYRHEPDDDPYCQECLEPLRLCECKFKYGFEPDDRSVDLDNPLKVAEGYPELPFPEDDEDQYDEEPF